MPEMIGTWEEWREAHEALSPIQLMHKSFGTALGEKCQGCKFLHITGGTRVRCRRLRQFRSRAWLAGYMACREKTRGG